MAKFKNGELKGKLGPVIGCHWKGKPYLRSKAVRTTPPTEGENSNRFVFDLVNDWLKPIHDFVRLGFRNYSETVWGINAANSLVHKIALNRDGFNSSIDPSLVKLSHGLLELPTELEAILQGETLLFYWSTETGAEKDPRDRIMMLAYNIEKRTAFYETSGPQRFQGFSSLPLQPVEPGRYHIYAAFISTSVEKQSESIYLGWVEL